MMTFIEKQQKGLLKKFHVLLGKAGIGQEGKEAILSSYGVESSRDLTAKDLLDVCSRLEMELNPELAEQDRWRKRVMAAVGGWLRSSGREENATYIKGVACRAAGRDDFNGIPVAALRNLYYEFKNKQKAHEAVNRIDMGQVLGTVYLN
jgi:hypothetical protein